MKNELNLPATRNVMINGIDLGNCVTLPSSTFLMATEAYINVTTGVAYRVHDLGDKYLIIGGDTTPEYFLDGRLLTIEEYHAVEVRYGFTRHDNGNGVRVRSRGTDTLTMTHVGNEYIHEYSRRNGKLTVDIIRGILTVEQGGNVEVTEGLNFGDNNETIAVLIEKLELLK